MFSFYGSKKSKAHLYPKPDNDVIIEPFAGAAGYSVLHRKHNVLLYDIDPRIVTVWQYLIDAHPKDILSLPMFGPGERIDSFGLSEPEKLFLGYMISAAACNPKKTATIKTNWNLNKQHQIANFVTEIKHWKVARSDFRNVTNIKATWFIDPPYEDAGKWYDYKLKSRDFFELTEFCKSRQGQVIVCENLGANWLPFMPLYQINGQKNNKRTEAIWTTNNE